MAKKHKPNSEEGSADRVAVFRAAFREDLLYWVKHDRKVALRVLALVDATLREPSGGIGKPEALRFLGPGLWSRRITQEHRLAYLVSENRIEFLQARYHYQ